jgi:hypothetical protein
MLPKLFYVLVACSLVQLCFCTDVDGSIAYYVYCSIVQRGAHKSLARPTSLSIVFAVQETGGSPTGSDPENRVVDQDIGSPGRPVSSGLQVPGEPFPSWLG